MDLGADPDESAKDVLSQESSELLHILSEQSPSVIMSLGRMVPRELLKENQQAPTSPAAASVTDIEIMLKYFQTSADAGACCRFLQSVCMVCENIPMRLESRLMSVAGHACSCSDICTPNTADMKPLTPPSEEQLVKRPRIDHWEQYITEVTSSLQRRWKRVTAGLVKEVQLEKVWVSIRNPSRSRDRPDQTPGSASRASRTQDPDVDYGCFESRSTLETFLQGCTGKVTVLVGQAGSGKTLLMSCLGQQWAKGLGPIPSSYLFVLLEFRQLNLLSCPLSLSQLLFQHYLPPNGGNHAKQAILDYLLSNPEQSCWVLDGYDEFHRKISGQAAGSEPLDVRTPVPVADLISGLLNGQLLPGSTVLVTCRVRDAVDLDGLSDKVGQLLEWDHNEMKEYVDNFFGVKDGIVGAKAADLLLSSRHLLAMSSVPGLCSICCICLEHLLLRGQEAGCTRVLDKRGDKTKKSTQETKEKEGEEEEDSRGKSRAQKVEQSGMREVSQDTTTTDTSDRAKLSPTFGQVPTTLSQVYLTVVAAFLSRYPNQGGQYCRPASPPSTVGALSILSHYQSELRELSRMAWRGLEESKILFEEEDIPRHVLELSIKTGLFSQVELRRHDGALVNAYCFVHLTVQEFLAAFRTMTSTDVSDEQLKRRFSLKTRWTTKSDQKSVFTDSLYLYVCGLASPQCTSALVQVARISGLKGVQSWVQKRQALVLNLLEGLCHSTSLTGPKLLQLCHCIQESQDHKLAKLFVSVRPTLELRNIWLLPNDIDALAFVINSRGNNSIGLDFGACSMELECLDALPRCQYIHHLSFRGRRYGDNFAEKLSSILPEFTTLRKLEFCGASLSATGAASLASGLQNCPEIAEINLIDNNLQDEGIRHIAEIVTKLQNLVSVTMGQNNTSLKAMDYLIEKMSSCLNIQHVHADGMKKVSVTFSQTLDNSDKSDSEPMVSLVNQKWSKFEMKNLVRTLAGCPALSVLDLSGAEWDEETFRTLAEFVPKFRITKKIILNDIYSSVECLVALTALLSDCLVTELSIRLQKPVQISVTFPGRQEKPASEMSKKLCLSCCNLLPADLERVWRSLGTASGLTVFDLSCNRLGDKGLKKLLNILPHLSKIQEINASNNGISMSGMIPLAIALCSHGSLMEIHLSCGVKDQLTLLFGPEESNGKQKIKMFRINNSRLFPNDVSKVCRRLSQCRFHFELEFSHCSFANNATENLVKLLPKMLSLQKLNVSSSVASTTDALELVRSLADNQRVTLVDLSPQNESVINFGEGANQASCRLTHFCFNVGQMERLLEILQQSQHLHYLDLSGNQLEDTAFKCLVDSLQRLKISSYINLSNNMLTQQGLFCITSTLVNCINVSAVEVSGRLGEDQRCLIWFRQNGSCEKTLSVREFSLERDDLVRLAEIVSSCPSMAKLEFSNNSLQSEWIEDLVKVLRPNLRGYTVSIEECWIRAEKAVHLLCRCLELNSHIQNIRIHQTTLYLSVMKTAALTSVSGAAEPPAQSVATNIGLVDCAVTGNQLASLWSVIQHCPSLTELDFSYITLGTDGAEMICSFLPLLPKLTSLSVAVKESTLSMVEEILQEVLQSGSIKCLNLSGHTISDTAAHNMTRLLPRLRSLNLSHCVWSLTGGLELLQTLQRCHTLEDLCLDSVQLNEESQACLAHALRNIKSVQSLKLNETVRVAGGSEADRRLDLLAAMEGITQMKEIQLGCWRLSDGGVQQLSRLLWNWTQLRTLCLSKNLIGDESGVKLLDALKRCSHLEELNLSSNRLGDLTAARMALVLPSLTHLAVLDISENRIGPEGSVHLSEAIMSLKSLTKFHLTSVGNSQLNTVAASLLHCPIIQDLGLGWNNCGDDVVLELAGVLPFCHKLTRIDLECNSVSVSGVDALVRAMRSCPGLHVVRLWRNKVSQNEAQRLCLREKRLNFSST
ncbi:NLR family, CARD domain containing 5 isoform X2 [Cololabis saira]|uniref:NLR family, CARD domain containing 5 isoform X2 n=1 Tax=Cololabis saira TaxID=129043 RepID=UPI002AD48C54|nr:NLR family, CARD domain containing 5 isoform X2 [Cololabis saira]